MNYEIRKIKKEELGAVQEIAKKVIREKYKVFFSTDAIEWFINSGESDKEFVNNFDNCNVLIENGTIRGFNIFFDNFIHLMMVDLLAQRKGYGKILLDYATNKMIGNGYNKFKLETFKENTQAINFYLKNGWLIKNEKKEQSLNVSRVFLEMEIA